LIKVSERGRQFQFLYNLLLSNKLLTPSAGLLKGGETKQPSIRGSISIQRMNISCQTYVPRNEKEMPQFDLQILAFFTASCLTVAPTKGEDYTRSTVEDFGLKESMKNSNVWAGNDHAGSTLNP